jgi:DNA topoisomerase 2-associated protein PAT1
VYHEVFQMLAPNFLFLFPSYRITGDTTANPNLPSAIDARAWTFFAVFAILADLAATRPGWPARDDERAARLANLNLFLHSLGLDASQIS